jgi:phage N-6-adenine-methyltransferase
VDSVLAEITTVAGAKDLLGKASAMQHYADRLKAGIEVQKPIAVGVLKIKTKLGELLPEGKRGPKSEDNSACQTSEFGKSAITAYRKMAANSEKLDDYANATDDVPTQGEFLKYIANGSIIATKHGNGIVDWYTPEKYIDAVRKVMGGIDLDPATSKCAQDIIKASTHYTEADDGLSKDWAGRVYLNPPFKMPEVKEFVFKLCDSIESKAVSQAIMLTNNNTDTKWFHRATRLCQGVCFTSGRISFYNAAGDQSSPTNGQSFCYFGKRQAAFAREFSKLGVVLCPALKTK